VDKSIRLIVADDHILIREGLVALLADEPGFQIVGQTNTGRDIIALARQHRPDIALIDLTLPNMSGLEITRCCNAEFPELKIIILTIHREKIFFLEALRAGVSGYFLKDASIRDLCRAIRSVHAGGIYLPPPLTGYLVQDLGNNLPSRPRTSRLTPREREILALVARGLSNHDIAKQLVLSPHTVKTYCLRIYRKLALRDRNELFKFAGRMDLLPVYSPDSPSG
jgi:two-component system response regulator NreC